MSELEESANRNLSLRARARRKAQSIQVVTDIVIPGFTSATASAINIATELKDSWIAWTVTVILTFGASPAARYVQRRRLGRKANDSEPPPLVIQLEDTVIERTRTLESDGVVREIVVETTSRRTVRVTGEDGGSSDKWSSLLAAAGPPPAVRAESPEATEVRAGDPRGTEDFEPDEGAS